MNFSPWLAAPILFGVGFPLLFAAVMNLLARLGGWSTLAAAYQTTDVAPKPRLRLQSADLRHWCNYGRCLTLSADAEALYMQVMFPLGFGHSKLKLPWAEADVKHAVHLFGIRTTEFVFLKAPNVPIRFRSRTAEALIAQARAAREASAE